MPSTDLEKGIYTGSPIQILQYDRKKLGGSETERILSLLHVEYKVKYGITLFSFLKLYGMHFRTEPQGSKHT